MTRLAAVVLILVGCVPMLAGCSRADVDADAAFDEFEQALVIEFDGEGVPLTLNAMDVWLTDQPTRPEAFSIHGDGIAFVGTLPGELRIGYAENWHVLIGKSVPISARGGDPQYPAPSVLTVPGVGQFRIVGGTFTVENVEPGRNGRTPLTGRIELRVRAAAGEKTLTGTFAVMAMTWG